MKSFQYIDAKSVDEAEKLLMSSKENIMVLGGGTDILGKLKENICPKQYPDALLNIKNIPGIDRITKDGRHLKIGAACKMAAVEKSSVISDEWPVLSKAARSVASPIIRNLATVGGNLCQDVRCWYYRYPDSVGGTFNCMRKGGDTCYALNGRNRYHSVMGGIGTGGNPCALECPAGTDIPAYMEKVRENKWDEAAEIIMDTNPLPMLTSRICPHPCQDKCNQCKNSESVSIHSVERAVGDYILENRDKFYKAPENETGKTAAIIGGGPAGLAAAYYLRKQGHGVTVYEKMAEAGGVLMYGIPEYRLPKHYVRDAVKAVEDMGVKFVLNTDVGKDISVEEIEKNHDTVFIDTGAWKQPILGIDGEKLTVFGLNFLIEVKQYISKLAGKDVLVCGGGNVAMDVALTAARLGAKNVKLVCLEQRGEMPATEEEILRAIEEDIEIINGRGLSRVIYEGAKVMGMETNKCVSVFDKYGRFSPKYDDTDLMTIKIDNVILATGQKVDLDFLGDKFRDELKNAHGLIEIGEHNDTHKPGVYAGGDVASGPSIAIKAIRDGANAAINMSYGLSC